MPDWITHISLAFLLATALRIEEHRSLVILGGVLPDTTKFSFLLDFLSPFNPFLVFHTAAGILLSAALISTFFDIPWRRGFFLILLGSALHLLLDSLQSPYGDYYWFLWPFWTGYKIGFIWQDSYLPAIFSSSAALAALLYKKRYIFIKPTK